jgi:NAD(P)-dependent dehydrogenase (short-subunit alcohol dehydrogenase family)
MQRFEGKVCVITGGSSGIGLAVARRLHREGANVVLFARSADALSSAERELGGRVLTVPGDVGEAADLARLYAAVAHAHGRIDVLFANAGIAEFVLFPEVSEEHYTRLFDTNVRGLFFSVQKALPLLASGASVVLNTSVANVLGVPRTSVYAATKAAVRSFARTFAGELLPRGVRVNAVSPGPTESAIHQKYSATLSPEALAEIGTRTMSRLALGRMAHAEEVAAAVAFLASAEAGAIVGQELAVDGGISAL